MTTKREYEKQITVLQERLERYRTLDSRYRDQAEAAEHALNRIRNARYMGEQGRAWAVEQAIRAGQTDIVNSAQQIANYVYGPDFDHDREEEKPT